MKHELKNNGKNFFVIDLESQINDGDWRISFTEDGKIMGMDYKILHPAITKDCKVYKIIASQKELRDCNLIQQSTDEIFEMLFIEHQQQKLAVWTDMDMKRCFDNGCLFEFHSKNPENSKKFVVGIVDFENYLLKQKFAKLPKEIFVEIETENVIISDNHYEDQPDNVFGLKPRSETTSHIKTTNNKIIIKKIIL